MPSLFWAESTFTVYLITCFKQLRNRDEKWRRLISVQVKSCCVWENAKTITWKTKAKFVSQFNGKSFITFVSIDCQRRLVRLLDGFRPPAPLCPPVPQLQHPVRSHTRAVQGELFFLKMALSVFLFFSSTKFTDKTLGLSRIRTRIVGVESEHSDHLSTNTVKWTLSIPLDYIDTVLKAIDYWSCMVFPLLPIP